ncbi:MAG TPA: prolyl oligopeptidase family serine peptidase, partial [Chloroflexota bacterium]|nr:prolyl oligopeptidase family serine peptidase [Chloroflexota bacterium]
MFVLSTSLKARRRLAGAALAVLCLLGPVAAPARADIVVIGREGAAAPLPLPAEEQAKLNTLLSATYLAVRSELSPDGKSVLLFSVAPFAGPDAVPPPPLQILDVETGALTPLPLPPDPAGGLAGLQVNAQSWMEGPRAPLRWLDDDTVQYLWASPVPPQAGVGGAEGASGQGRLAWALVTADLRTGAVHRTELPVQGFVQSASPDLSRLVELVPVAAPPEEERIDGVPLGVLTDQPLQDLVVYLVTYPSGERVEVGRIPAGYTTNPPSWTRDGLKAVITAWTPAAVQLGRTPFSPPLDHPAVQDTLGRLPPAENPIPRHNVLRVYDFTRADPLRLQLDAATGNGDLFREVAMSPDGTRFLVQRQRPGLLAGRPHPSYHYPDRSTFEVYSLDGELLDTIDRPELANPNMTAARFLDPGRVLFRSLVGLDVGLFVYDLATRELRRLPLPRGTVGTIRNVFQDWDWPAVDAARGTAVFVFSSFVQPPEVFRMPLDGSAPPARLTAFNAALEGVDRVRADRTTFTLSDGQRREGVLLQPAGAPFPPRDVPIVLWQQGGPGLSMEDAWAALVEIPHNLLPNFGLAVLHLPLAGREGFGPDFYRRQAEGDHFGKVDLDEAAEIVDQLVAMGWTSYDRVGVSGCSYGGYFAAQAIVRHPQTFAAANPQCALLD